MHPIQLQARVVEQLCDVATSLGLNAAEFDWEVAGFAVDGGVTCSTDVKATYKPSGSAQTGFRIMDVYFKAENGEIIQRGRFIEL